MGKSEEISDLNPTDLDPEPWSRHSSVDFAVDPSPSDLDHSVKDSRDQFRTLRLDETANEQSGTVVVSEANGDANSTVEGADEEEEEEGRDDDNENEIEKRKVLYPVRPEAEDCAYYMRTGNCKFGSSCRFNHPIRRKNQAARDKVKEREDDVEKLRQIECKYYLRTGGCKYGDSCRYSHSKPKNLVAPVSELNFLGLPIRLGERECPYYMRNGSCKFGADCKFNHPDPTAIGGSDSPRVYGHSGSLGSFSPQHTSQASSASWSSPRPLNGPAPFMPVLFPQTHGVPSRATEWNGYQAPVYSPDRSVVPPAPYLKNNSPNETNTYLQHQPQMPVDEFPERPGQPECSYYLKTGDCKFKYKCKYHHPKNRLPKQPPCSLSDKGLPLRPDQIICAHYSRYGICKFGPACKFDHSVQPPSSTGTSQVMEAAQVDASGNESDGWN